MDALSNRLVYPFHIFKLVYPSLVRPRKGVYTYTRLLFTVHHPTFYLQ